MSERPPRRRYHVPAGTWDVERIILALRDWAELVGDPPRVLDWCPVERSEPTYRAHLWERHYPRWPEHSTVSHALGSWRQALIAAELPVDRPPLALPLQDRIAAARIMHAQGLAHAEIAAELGVHPNVIGKYLHAHLCKCGENYVVVGRLCTTCANRRAPARSWTREDLLAAILRWSDLEGRPPTSEQWQTGPDTSSRWEREYPDWPTVKDVQRDFGSWNQALRAAGITPVHPIGVTKADVLAALRDARADLGDKLSYKSYTAWAADRRRPSIAPLRRHFGTFNNALRDAGIATGSERGARRDLKRRARPQ